MLTGASDLRLRRAGPEDATACAAILQDWLDATPWMPDLHDLAETTGWMRKGLFATAGVTVAEAEGAVRGYIALAPDGCVLSLAVAAGWRGRGIGKGLLDRAKAEAAGGLTLWTFVANEAARRFYAREGFTEVRRTSGENAEGLPDILLAWPAPGLLLRRARAGDAADCALIVNDWIDATPWMPRVASREAIAGVVAKGIVAREVWVAGDPVAGYISVDPAAATVRGLYVARPGRGVGRALLMRAKAGREVLRLRTHAPNEAAQRFYRREGFVEAGRDPAGEDGLPEIVMEWRGRAALAG